MFASKAWVSEKGVASKEDKDSYWDDAPPVWQVLAWGFLVTTYVNRSRGEVGENSIFDHGVFFVLYIPLIASSALKWDAVRRIRPPSPSCNTLTSCRKVQGNRTSAPSSSRSTSAWTRRSWTNETLHGLSSPTRPSQCRLPTVPSGIQE